MKKFFIKNKGFVSLFTIALLIILLLSIYVIQKQVTSTNVKQPEEEEVVDPNKETEITALSASYNRSSKDNIITVSWNYMENNAKVTSAELYLNENEAINVTQNRYYDFPQSVYDFPTGDNHIRLELILENGRTIEKDCNVFVQYIISTKQDVVLENNVVKVTLEYVYDAQRPVNAPEILLASTPVVAPQVDYLDTQTTQNGRKIIARSTFAFTWDMEANIPAKFSVRWKFNEILDNFDYTVTKPQKQAN